MNTNTEILNKILAVRIQEYIKGAYTIITWDLS